MEKFDKCSKCGSCKSTVVDSRVDGDMKKRRRKCLPCNNRWSTYEVKDPNSFKDIEAENRLGKLGLTPSEAADLLTIIGRVFNHER